MSREDITIDMLILMLQELGVYGNASEGQLIELLAFVREAESGFVMLQ